MSSSGNLLVIFTTGRLNEAAFSREEKRIKRIISQTDTPEVFATVFELAGRYHITQNRKKIILASQKFQLKPFRFLINKN